MDPAFLTSLWGHDEPPRDPPIDHRAEKAKHAVELLETRLDRALLTMEALWTLLRDRLGVTEEELLERIVEIDLTDGVLDGKVRRPPMDCQACGRRVSRRFARCMYCGEELVRDPFS